MALRLIYQMFSKLMGWMVLRTRTDITERPHLGIPTPPRRTRRPRPRDRRLHHLEHPAQHRHRPIDAASRTIFRIPAGPGARDPRLRPARRTRSRYYAV